MRYRIVACALAAALQGWAVGAPPGDSGIETKTFAVQRGDALSITHDSGEIRIRSSEGGALEIKARRAGLDQSRKSSLEIATRKSGNTLFVSTVTSGAPGEAADLEITAPKFLNLAISGASPNVIISGMQGQVRVQDSAGRITVEDLASSTSLSTDNADIIYRASAQPQGDVHLESASGNVYCELSSGLNLHTLLKAGGKIFWDMDPMLQATSLEKQLGATGPLLYAASLTGNVTVRLIPSSSPATAVASDRVIHHGDSEGNNPGTAVSQAPTGQSQSAGAARQSPSSGAPSAAVQDVRRASATTTSAEPVNPQSPAPTQTAPVPPAKDSQAPMVVQGGYALKVNVDSVFLNVSVRDRSTNRSIAGLQKPDFLIYEDGVRQQVDQFLPTEAPFNLMLLLDVSGSTASYLRLMKQAAIDFTKQINASDRVAVATFNSNVELVQGFTNDRSAAERAIQKIRSGGGTAFYDALMTCLDRYMRGIEGRSAIVVFTDGVDNQLQGRYSAGSRTTYDQLYRRVQESDIIIYTIFLDTEGQVPAARGRSRYPGGGGWPGGRRGGRFPGSSPFPFPFPTPTPSPSPYPSPSPSPYPRQREDQTAIYEEARNQLLQIAEQTGGRMYSPHKVDELSSVYSEIADDLRVQYQLGYNSTNRAHDGKWREIRVEVENHPDAAVRTRKGYYARGDATQ